MNSDSARSKTSLIAVFICGAVIGFGLGWLKYHPSNIQYGRVSGWMDIGTAFHDNTTGASLTVLDIPLNGIPVKVSVMLPGQKQIEAKVNPGYYWNYMSGQKSYRIILAGVKPPDKKFMIAVMENSDSPSPTPP